MVIRGPLGLGGEWEGDVGLGTAFEGEVRGRGGGLVWGTFGPVGEA